MCFTALRLWLLHEQIKNRNEAKAAAAAAVPPPGTPPSIFELLQCWLLYGPSLTTFSPSNQTFSQMLSCWDSSAYRVHRTPLPAASVQVFNDTYGKYFQASGQAPEFRGFPSIQLDNFRKCWAEHGDGSADPLFSTMMDVWEANGKAFLQANAYKAQPNMEVKVEPVTA